jgi:hypothetical protein
VAALAVKMLFSPTLSYLLHQLCIDGYLLGGGRRVRHMTHGSTSILCIAYNFLKRKETHSKFMIVKFASFQGLMLIFPYFSMYLKYAMK